MLMVWVISLVLVSLVSWLDSMVLLILFIVWWSVMKFEGLLLSDDMIMLFYCFLSMVKVRVMVVLYI